MKRYFLLLLCAVSVLQLHAQGKRQIEYSGFFDSYYYRGPITYTGGLGVSTYRGDLTDNAFDFNPAFNFNVGAFYKTWPRTAFGGEFNYTSLRATDANTSRNLKFTGSVLSLGAYVRFYLIDDVIRNARDRSRKPKIFKPYVMTGISLMQYKATSSYTGATTDTIMESYRYPLKGISIPAGLGFQWAITHRVGFATEFQYNFTFTDKLDGVSERGDPSHKDGYALITFKVQYCPSAPAIKKSKSLPPPAQYDGPKGTETWKTRKEKEKSERPAEPDYYIPGEDGNGEEDPNADPNANPDGDQNMEDAPPAEDAPSDAPAEGY